MQVGHISNNIKRGDSPSENGCEHHIEIEIGIFQSLTGYFSFFDPTLTKWYISPASESVFFIPLALSMSQEYDFVCSLVHMINKFILNAI